ncbi:hypothetical protein [Phenylobacterium sp.]|jgi:hypothetical protein|uniref:hypothetical protein n=1 Tax=Phenylobacterium sp. TaxID=1871053 RepID=UPI002F920EB7
MSCYRIYVLDQKDRIAAELEEPFASDRAALVCAEVARIGQYAAEVWKGEQLVGRLGGVLPLEFAT